MAPLLAAAAVLAVLYACRGSSCLSMHGRMRREESRSAVKCHMSNKTFFKSFDWRAENKISEVCRNQGILALQSRIESRKSSRLGTVVNCEREKEIRLIRVNFQNYNNYKQFSSQIKLEPWFFFSSTMSNHRGISSRL